MLTAVGGRKKPCFHYMCLNSRGDTERGAGGAKLPHFTSYVHINFILKLWPDHYTQNSFPYCLSGSTSAGLLYCTAKISLCNTKKYSDILKYICKVQNLYTIAVFEFVLVLSVF